MQPQHSKAFMIEFLRSKSTKAYKRKIVQNTEVTVLEPTDMDIDDDSDDNGEPLNKLTFEWKIFDFLCLSFSDATDIPLGERLAQLENDRSTKIFSKLNDDTLPTLPLGSQSPLSEGEISDNEPKQIESPRSPSLDDLNERKKRLLNALDDSTISISSVLNKPIEDDSLIDDIMALNDESTLESSVINDENGDASKIDTTSVSLSYSPPATPDVQSAVANKIILHASKGAVTGTPVIKGVSPFNNLPNSEKWREGVSDVMDFENLPESVGKYEKMRTLLETVRVKVKKIQYEDNEDG